MKTDKSTKSKLNRNVLNIIRTTQRNNIDLKHIADNKANILMSVNALMITFLIPIILTNLELIRRDFLYIPLSILAITCIVTVLISATVLKPFSTSVSKKKGLSITNNESPFFFQNSDKYSTEEYVNYFSEVVMDDEIVLKYVVQDLHYFSKVLSIKYRQIRWAYLTFMTGLIMSLVVTIITLII